MQKTRPDPTLSLSDGEAPEPPPSSPSCRSIAGIEVVDAEGGSVIKWLIHKMDTGGLPPLAFLNAHCVNVARSDPTYHFLLRRFLVLPDGIGVDIAAKVLYGATFRENLNGTDFTPRLLAALGESSRRVALIGAAPGVAERAAEQLALDVPAHDYIALSDGYFGEASRTGVLKRLEQSRADIVLIALGVPSQERFIADHLTSAHGRLFIGVGALFDFLAGEVVRAPKPIRLLRAEWIWRLVVEPSRLWRRYVLGNPKFLIGILRDRLRQNRHP